MEIPSKYAPGKIEEKWAGYWEKHQLFRSVPDDREPYTIVIPPPNVTGMLHMGHMLNNTIQDILIRRKRMQGFNACWVPGTDHASIATEAKVVGMLRERGIKKSDLSRDEFLKYAFEWKDKYGGIILHQLRRLGASCDWERTRFTMDDDYYKSIIQIFVDLFEKGHVYRAKRMVNWDPQGLTALSDEEVIYKESTGKLYHLRYQIEGTTDQWVTIATTRPETILGDTAISVHPEDERYKHLVGKNALIPLLNRPIPIIADEYVDREFGTGCLKVTPAHDVNDYEIGQRHNLEIIDILNPNGTLSEDAKLYVGKDRFEVRKLIVADLEAAGHVVKVVEHLNKIGHSERTDAVIEPRLSLQWWVAMKELSKPALEAVMNDDVQLIPAKFKNTYRHWMENVKDWCISRQLWWGHRIPAWYLESEREALEGDRQFFVALDVEGALEKARAATGNSNLTAADLYQDEAALDTWFSSWLWPFQVFKGLTEPGNAEVEYYYPTNDLVTGPDILFFWVARMIIAGYEWMDEKPFNNVYLTGLIRDRLGRKMSKSLGNSPDPLDLMALYGADGVRAGILLSSPAGNDLTFDTPLDLTKEPLNSKLCELGRNYCNKMWNAFRLVAGWEAADRPMTDLDVLSLQWMESRMHQVLGELEEKFDAFRISEALHAVIKLIWDELCSWFLELMKPGFGEGVPAEALAKVKVIFEEMLKITHPFTPFISEDLWHRLAVRKEGESINLHTQLLAADSGKVDLELMAGMDEIQTIVAALRTFRTEKGISMKNEIELYVKTANPALFERFGVVITKFLKVSALHFTDGPIAGSASVVSGTHEFFIPVGNTIDVEAEKAKINAEIEYHEGFLAKVMVKLDNEKFVNSAPRPVVEAELKKKADAEEKLAVLRQSLANLG